MMRSGIALAVIVLAAGCGGSEEEEQPGEPAVYAKIEAETDCTELQATFDSNIDKAERRQETDANDPLIAVVLSYAEAADERMAEVGCYEGE